jgi:hypothetical protein
MSKLEVLMDVDQAFSRFTAASESLDADRRQVEQLVGPNLRPP